MSDFDHKLALSCGTLSPSLLYPRYPSVTESVVLPPDLGEHHAEIQPSQVQPVKLWWRFEMVAGALSGDEFCLLDFPWCKGCPKAQHTVRTLGSQEGPMKPAALRGWLRALRSPKTVIVVPISEVSYGEVHSPAEPRPIQETSR